MAIPGVGLDHGGRLRCTMFDVGSDGDRVVCGRTYPRPNEDDIRAHQEARHANAVPYVVPVYSPGYSDDIIVSVGRRIL